MSEIVNDAKHTMIELTDSTGISLSGTNSRIKHTGSGVLTIESPSGQVKFGQSTDVTFASDVTLDNDNNTTQYINLNYSATASNQWRLFVNSSGQLEFQRFNGSSWVNKFYLE